MQRDEVVRVGRENQNNCIVIIVRSICVCACARCCFSLFSFCGHGGHVRCVGWKLLTATIEILLIPIAKKGFQRNHDGIVSQVVISSAHVPISPVFARHGQIYAETEFSYAEYINWNRSHTMYSASRYHKSIVFHAKFDPFTI